MFAEDEFDCDMMQERKMIKIGLIWDAVRNIDLRIYFWRGRGRLENEARLPYTNVRKFGDSD